MRLFSIEQMYHFYLIVWSETSQLKINIHFTKLPGE